MLIKVKLQKLYYCEIKNNMLFFFRYRSLISYFLFFFMRVTRAHTHIHNFYCFHLIVNLCYNLHSAVNDNIITKYLFQLMNKKLKKRNSQIELRIVY